MQASLTALRVPWWFPLREDFTFGNRKKSAGAKSGLLGLGNRCDAVLRQQVGHLGAGLAGSIVVMKFPILHLFQGDRLPDAKQPCDDSPTPL